MNELEKLLKKSGYSEKTINYYLKKTNVGKMENPTVLYTYTGPCGDTMEIYLKIDSALIKDAMFQATGCAALYGSGSALTGMIKGKTIEEAEKISEEDIIDHLGGVPEVKRHCACLAKRTLEKAIKEYRVLLNL